MNLHNTHLSSSCMTCSHVASQTHYGKVITNKRLAVLMPVSVLVHVSVYVCVSICYYLKAGKLETY